MSFSRITTAFLILMLPFGSASGIAATTNNQGNVNTEELKQDYRAFLQQLKQLNSQYKQVTGQMAQVMKEEGVPSWDAGDAGKQIDQLFPQEPETFSLPDSAMTLKETDKDLTVTMDMPGIQKDTIKIAVQNAKKLVVSAQRKLTTGAKKLEKSLDLPSTVDPKQAKAGYQDGVLTITFAKTSTQQVLIPVR